MPTLITLTRIPYLPRPKWHKYGILNRVIRVLLAPPFFFIFRQSLLPEHINALTDIISLHYVNLSGE